MGREKQGCPVQGLAGWRDVAEAIPARNAHQCSRFNSSTISLRVSEGASPGQSQGFRKGCQQADLDISTPFTAEKVCSGLLSPPPTPSPPQEGHFNMTEC